MNHAIPPSPRHNSLMRGAARRTASTITDPELDQLYAQLDYLLVILAAVRLSDPPQSPDRAQRHSS
ncbi:hypothetical protein [Streptomyces sp. MMBL 11-1]|uniref:hypothetical protein n=1 Tax=Streptomyces sp. MMBL 11-1 TaxID=3026420 RepID=UPI00235DDD16|nr:hypothetical protein [Streptomyces sp. MMBL 11-1]